MKWFELHKHSQYSIFDGFGNPKEIAEYAKQLGMEAVAITDHGTINSMGSLYLECKKLGIKPIIGIEAYFQPKFDPEKKRYHLCLYASNLEGYRNLSQIITIANRDKFYRRMTVDFELLEKYSKGIICSSACVAGIVPGALMNNNYLRAKKATKKFKQIFGDNFYFEIMPIPFDEKGTQERVNKEIYKLGNEMGVKCIPTTDSHFTKKEDFDSYTVMRNLSSSGAKYFNEATYCDRYMHSKKDIITKLRKEFKDKDIKSMLNNMHEIYDKIEVYDLEALFKSSIPKSDDTDTPYDDMKKECIARLKELGKWNKKYIDRLKFELKIIKAQNLSDYFLIVSDYVKYAKDNDIYVGPGRGSVCNSLVAYLLKITTVDAVDIDNDFERFIRADKIKMPDIDLDFENGDKRGKVIDYLINKYKGRAAQILTYGLYKKSNTINDITKLFEISKEDHAIFKKHVNRIMGSDEAHFQLTKAPIDELLKNKHLKRINDEYSKELESGTIISEPVKHFAKLYGHVRYYGTHPAGVVITNDDIGKFIPLMKVGGNLSTALDKYDVEGLGLLKFDMLALITMNIIYEMEYLSNDKYNPETCPADIKELMYNNFKTGNTTGIFQLNKDAAKQILVGIEADSLNDLIAAVSLNRPGPLKLKMHEQYAANKIDPPKNSLWYEHTKDAYGTLIYQEHVMKICRDLAKMNMNDVDKLMKFKFSEEEREILKEKFIKGMLENNKGKVKKEELSDLFDSMTLYLFNKGHGSGYAMISEWQMYHRVKNPTEYWMCILKYNYDKMKEIEYKKEAVKSGQVIFLSNINYSLARNCIRVIEDEKVIQEGLINIKGVGEKAADLIVSEREANGPYIDIDDLALRCKGRSVTSGVIKALKEYGAHETDDKKYYSRVTKYNSTLFV